MANIEFVKGVRCKRCGEIIAQPTIFTSELCQGCGAKLIDTNISRRTYSLSDNAESVTIKVIHKFFKDVYKVVEVNNERV